MATQDEILAVLPIGESNAIRIQTLMARLGIEFTESARGAICHRIVALRKKRLVFSKKLDLPYHPYAYWKETKE